MMQNHINRYYSVKCRAIDHYNGKLTSSGYISIRLDHVTSRRSFVREI